MNTLDDLRSTLDQHAYDSTAHADLDPSGRVAQVRARVRRARQRRTAGSVAAAVVAVAAVGGGALLAGAGDRTPEPAREGLLEQVPRTMESLGWTYRLAETTQVGRDELRRTFEASDRPRLLTWAVEGDVQDVVLVLEGGDRWVSDAADFEDFVVLPEGFEGEVLLTANRSGVALATYEVDEERPPEGASEDGIHYRAQAGSRRLVGAGIGEPGESDLSFDYEVPARDLAVSHSCSGFPEESAVNIALDGSDDAIVVGACQERFDPAAHTSVALPDVSDLGPGSVRTARIWVSASTEDSEPVDPAAYPQGRISLGVYSDQLVHEGGQELPVERERWGHVFSYAGSTWGPERRIAYPLHGEGPWLMTTSVRHASEGVTVRALVDGRRSDSITSSVSNGSWEVFVPADASLFEARTVEGAEDLRRLGVHAYERAD